MHDFLCSSSKNIQQIIFQYTCITEDEYKQIFIKSSLKSVIKQLYVNLKSCILHFYMVIYNKITWAVYKTQ